MVPIVGGLKCLKWFRLYSPPPPPLTYHFPSPFVFFLSSGFCLVLALVARVCYCLVFFLFIIRFVIFTFTPIFFIKISFVFSVVPTELIWSFCFLNFPIFLTPHHIKQLSQLTFFSPVETFETCPPGKPGYYLMDGVGPCVACPGGTVNPPDAVGDCTPCAEGTVPKSDASECLPCEPGMMIYILLFFLSNYFIFETKCISIT